MMTLQTRRTTGLTPLDIVLPHPPLPRRSLSKSSLLSSGDPHTPRSCHSPSLSNLHAVCYQSSNRKSSDSWNSSNADEMEYEWLPDQILFLSRTLDALPAHLITPFHGPVPPSNLLDKIARSVSQAKGPTDWPHSIRATRVKLLELARMKAKDEKEKARERNRHLVIREEVEMDDIHTGVDSIEGPRPLYRQSSMDFIKPGPEDIKENTAIARLSKRLQRTDRLLTTYQYHPYSRPKGSPADSHIPGTQTASYNLKHRRSSSPPHPHNVPSLISPSTPSSSTLNSLSSASALTIPRGLRLRRSASTMSSISLCDSADGALVDPRVQRLKLSETHREEPLSPPIPSAPVPPPKDECSPRGNLKRAPSYGAVKQEVKLERQRNKDATTVSASVTKNVKQPRHERKLSTGSYISTDEEEKSRSKRVKKLKTSLRSSSSPVPSSPPISGSSPSHAMGIGMDTAPSSPVDRTPSEKMSPSVPEIRVKSPKSATSTITAAIESRRVTRSKLNLAKGDADMKEMTKSSTTTKALSPTNLRSKASSNRPSARPLPMNLQRNPSMFGAELPPLPVVDSLCEPAAMTLSVGDGFGKRKGGEMSSKKEMIRSSSPVSPLASKSGLKSPTLSPSSPGTRTLRRVRKLDLGGFGLGARKIEFGSSGGNEENKTPRKRNVLQRLESAIKLV